jgi:hypothetical protein
MSITKEQVRTGVYWLILIFLVLSLTASIIGLFLLLTCISEWYAASIVIACSVGYLIGYISIIKDE